MSEREALLAAVIADPDNDLSRLVYADWCDDHGDPDRAEFIRVQCALARGATDPGLAERAGELVLHFAEHWRRQLPRPIRNKYEERVDWERMADGWLDGPAFDRGFPTKLWVKAAGELFDHAGVLFGSTPVRRLMIHSVVKADKLVRLPQLRHLHTFRCRILSKAAADMLIACPYLDPVPDVRLPLHSSALTPDHVARVRKRFGDRFQEQW